jgi:F420-dependent oxidoreductase-like protein
LGRLGIAAGGGFVAKDLKLGLQLGYWGAHPPEGFVETARVAESLGFDSVWTAEAWGSDAFTPLAWIGAHTERIKLGTAIVQLSGRTPTSTAMHAMTLDHLSKGRVILGLGVSGPQVVEGWYGRPFGKPLSRTREYIDIIRQVMRREGPVTSDGPHYPLPYTGEGSWGLGEPLKSIVHPLRADLPIYLGAEGPKNVALAAELCDGWLPLFFAPKDDAWYRRCLEEGFAAAGEPGKAERFDVGVTLMVVPGEDVEQCADLLRPMLALYAGGMGAKGQNFHFDVFARMGYEAEATKIQELYLAGRKAEAIAAVPLAMVEDIALIGPPDRIRGELAKWRETCLTTFIVSGPAQTLGPLADLLTG